MTAATEDDRPDDKDRNLVWSGRTPESCDELPGSQIIDWLDAVICATVVFLTLVSAIGRFTVPTRHLDQFGWPLTYEAVAHVTFGWLVGLAHTKKWRFCWFLAAGLLAIEILCFLFRS